jgi:short subunit dehydrogenase-like uncharacterized protein
LHARNPSVTDLDVEASLKAFREEVIPDLIQMRLEALSTPQHMISTTHVKTARKNMALTMVIDT